MLPYATVAGVQYFQTYLYAYNDIVVLQRGTNTNAALTIESNMEYSYPMTRPISLTLPSYYRIIIMLKYSSNSVCGLTLSATTPSTTQT